MNKIGVLIGLLLLSGVVSFSLSNAVAVDKLSDVPGGQQVQNAGEVIQNITKTIEEKKWDYLGDRWKEVLLKNKYASAVDGFLKKIDFVFVVLFGEHYDFSLTLLFVVLLWLYFFLSFALILKNFSTFSAGVSYVLGFAFAVVSAQIGIYRKIAVLMFKVIFFREGIWGWIAFFTLIILMFFFYTFLKMIARMIRKKRDESNKKDIEMHEKVIKKTAEGIEEAFEE